MPKFKFSKLVRDKIVKHQISSGAKPHYRKLTNNQHKEELIEKIIEEAREITHAKPTERVSEIADVQQALDDLIKKYGISRFAISKAQKAKLNKNGAFKEGIYIDYVEVDENDKWVKYYRKNSDRYPEIK